MQIRINDSIKDEIAQRVVEQATPGYHSQGSYYVVNGERVVFAQTHRPWDPWNDDDAVVSVEDLVFICGGAEEDRADFDPSPEGDVSDEDAYEAAVLFASGYVPDAYDPADVAREAE